MLLFTTGCKISSDNKDPVELPDNQYKEHFCGMCMYCWKTEDDHVCDRLLENVEPSVVIKNYYKDKNAELTTYRSIVGEKYQTQYREFTYYDSGYLKTAAFTDEHTVPDNNDLTVTYEFTDLTAREKNGWFES